MVQMIPPSISENTKSKAEHRIYTAFQNIPDCSDWTVMHSVRIANHETQSQGESDFIVIAPGKGIFVLEVKGGQKISCENGKWTSTDFFGNIHEIKDPGVEANDGMHSIINFCRSKDRSISSVLTGFGVAFPDITVHGKLIYPDLDDAQIADASDIIDIKKYIGKLSKFWREKLADNKIFPPTEDQCKRIVELLRPNVSLEITLGTEIKTLENDIIRLTSRQQEIFEGLDDNSRVLVAGSAGTGKTLIALNYAGKLLESGKRIALFCYNVQLAEYLKKALSMPSDSECGSFTEYMERTALTVFGNELISLKENSKAEYYSHLLPEKFTEAFIQNELPTFDYLIVDEAQDIMAKEYIDALDLILDGGIKEGHWIFFMDFEKQNLFHSPVTFDQAKELLDTKSNYAKFRLKENCRNSVSIIRKLDEYFGSETTIYRNGSFGPEVEIINYEKNNEQAAFLKDSINKLLSEDIEPKNITILSPVRFENSVVSMIADTFKIETSKNARINAITFSTISSFKGLENNVIILVDFDKIKSDMYKNTLYVGMTRARDMLIMFMHKKVIDYISKHKGNL